MPEQEFEIYLSLLGKLLKLSPAQKAAISDEFRDHLEERLASLIQSGMSRQEAIRVAMDEFGDVNGLAIDLTRASRTPLRTVAIRSTIVASIMAVAIVGWITLFVPEHRIAAPPSVQADQNAPAAKTIVTATTDSLNVKDEQLFPEFLTKQTDVNFEDTPLQEACRKLESIHGIPVVLQKSGLDDAGVSVDCPVTLKLTGLTFEEVLNHLTRKLDITWQVHGGLVQITTREKQKYLTRQYDLHNLAHMGHKLGILMNALMQMTGDESCLWEQTDGEGGTMSPVGKTLVVRQSFKTHQKIAKLLKTIESLNQPVVMLDLCSNRDRLMKALGEQSSIDVVDAQLQDVIQSLAERHGIPILIDERSLSEQGVDSKTPLTLNLKDRSLATIFEFLFDDLHLTYQLRDGVVMISSETIPRKDMMVVAYNVGDLISTSVSSGQLMQAILQSVNDDQWEIINGEGGTMTMMNTGNVLLIKQTDRAHAKINEIFNQLRKNKHDPDIAANDSSTPEPKMITKDYRMPKDVAANLMTALPKLVSPGKWTDTGREDSPTIEMIASKPVIENVQGLVSGGSDEVRVLSATTNSSKNPDKNDADGSKQVQSIVSRPRSSLVIRQTPEIHRQIRDFLQKLNVDFVEGTPFQKADGFTDGLRVFQGGLGGMGGGMGGTGGGGFGG